MKYLMLIYSSPATWNALSQEQRDQLERDHSALYHELVESGEWIGGNALADPSTGTAVRVRDGVTMATDGPYAEVKEHLAGYDLIECDSKERAIEIAARIPDAAVCGVEIRPVMETGAGSELW
ncbi:YciI family protein [Pseudonocardia acaciae]|uniref:YciI family protein n=1 Tax=Pseudonocardia acaciae TaxID=551276 RepID=UPI00048E9297|nr:YciI family protein [Pseudonocardia acaciae]